MLQSAALALALLSAAADPAPPTWPKLIPAPGGEVIIPDAAGQAAYDEFKFAPARRAGDYLYISGVIAGPRATEGRDGPAFTAQVRRAFTGIEAILKAQGLTFADVTMINTFHVCNGPGFTGTRDEQFAAFARAKDAFMPPPHPAWTAVGATGLLIDNGVVEIQMIAYAPQAKRRR